MKVIDRVNLKQNSQFLLKKAKKKKKKEEKISLILYE